MSRLIRTAIVGCGMVGHTHALAMQQLPQSELAAAFDRRLEKARVYGDRYHIAAYDNLEDMIKKEGVEMVSICTPHPFHTRYILPAANLGVHVLSEKPLASDLQDCDLAIDVCRQNGVKLGVVSQRRYYAPVVRMVEAIQAGKIGTPIIASMVVKGWRSPEYYLMNTWRGKWKSEGGGVMVNQTVHQLDLLQWLMGPIDELFGYWDNFNHPTTEVEDTAVATIRFNSGAIGQFLVSNAQNPGLYGKIHIHGSNGASIGAQTEGGSTFVSGVTSLVEPPINDLWTIPGEEQMLIKWQAEDQQFALEHDPMTYYHKLQIDDFLQAIIDQREPFLNGEEGRKSVELFTAVYRSQRDRMPVQFPLQPETEANDYDGRLSYKPYSHRNEKSE